MIVESSLGSKDVKALLSIVEKMKSARTDQQYQPIFETLNKIGALLSESLSSEVVNCLPDVLQVCVNFVVNHKEYPVKFIGDIEGFLKAVLKYICKQMDSHNLKLSDIFRVIMDPVRMIHDYNNHGLSSQEYMGTYSLHYSPLLNPNYKQFLTGLCPGMLVDCVREDRATNRFNWSRAIITGIDNSQVTVRYLNESTVVLRELHLESGQLMPFKSRSVNVDELANLKYMNNLYRVSQHVLATSTDRWIKSTVLEVVLGENEFKEQTTHYLIGFRHYCEDGDCIEDQTELRYVGLNRGFDELISANSPRLASDKHKQLVQPKSTETFIDDSLDSLYLVDYYHQKFYGILRPKQSKGMIIPNLVNYFGEIGGFDLLLKKFTNTQLNPEQCIPVDIMANYLQGVGNVHAQLFKYFAIEYVPLLTQSIRDNLLNAPEIIIRNMGKEKMQQIMFACILLLERTTIQSQWKKWIHNLSLDFVIVCFRCDFLDKKIMGLRLLTEMLQNSDTDKQPEFGKYLINWIAEQGIMETLFSTTTHLQLLSRSNDILRVFMKLEAQLTNTHLDLIWNLMEQDDLELRPTIFKVITDIALSMQSQHVQYFQNKIAALPVKSLLVEHINLVFEMNRYQMKQQDLIYQAICILWSVVEYQSQFNDFFKILQDSKFNKPKELEEKARCHICDLLKNFESKEYKLLMVKQLMTNIEQQRVESSSLKTISHLISSLPTEGKDVPFSQEELVAQLAVQGLPQVLLRSIVAFRNSVKAMEKPTEWPIDLQAGYMNKLQERVLLVKSMIRISKTAVGIVDLEFLSIIWNELVMSALCKTEGDMASNWVKDLIEKESMEMLIQFYKLNFQSEEGAMVISENAFDCFKALLGQVNGLNLIKPDSITTNGITAIYNQHGKVTQMTNSIEEEKVEPEWQVCVPPNQIEGIDFLWMVVYLNNKSLSLQEKAAQFLVKLHLNVSVSLQHERQSYISDLIEKLIRRMAVADETRPPNFKQIILRSLLVLKCLVNESEVKGIGTLKSLGGLVRGDIVTLNIQNDLTGEPKKGVLKLYGNTTIMELRLKIAKLIKASWDTIRVQRANLFNQSRDILDTENGKTIHQVGLKKNENLIIVKRKCPPLPQVELMNSDGTMTKQFNDIVASWFAMYSTNNKMNAEQAAKFASKAAGDYCQTNDSRITSLFQIYDKDGDSLLDLEEFQTFYYDSYKANSQIVWKNLHMFNYRNDLKSLDDVQTIEIDEQSLPRAILANHTSFFTLMFHLLREETDIAQECWRLMNVLPASKQVSSQIMNINNPNWKNNFPMEEPFHLLYCLKIVEYSLGSGGSDQLDEPEESQDTMSLEQYEQQNEWRNEFIMSGGFQLLIEILSNSIQQPANSINKQIQTFILSIMRLYLAAALQPKIPNIYQVQLYTRQALKTTIDIIQQAIDQQDPVEQEIKALKLRVKEPEDFWHLANNLKNREIGNKILDCIDAKLLLQLSLVLMIKIESKDEIDSEEKQLLELCMVLITTLVVSDIQNVCAYFMQEDLVRQVFHKTIFLPKYLQVRKVCSNTLFLVFKFQPHLGPFLVQTLYNMFPDPENKDTQQYFDAFCKLIEESEPDPVKYGKLGEQMMRLLRCHPNVELRTNSFNDKTLTGYLALLESLCKVEQSILTLEFAEYLFKTCLFCFGVELPDVDRTKSIQQDVHPDNYVRCKSVESRRLAYRILVQYAAKDFNSFSQILDITPILKMIPLVGIFNYKPQADVKFYQNYVGLRNLGCICYMNAMLQQFYMTPEFRYAMLRADDGQPENMQIFKDQGNEYNIDDNIIHQFQKMFAYQELSDRHDYNPYRFCFAFKDYDNQPVNVRIQQDAQEFLNTFFDRLEHGLKAKGWHQTIEGVYGGRTCNQIICSGCNNVREHDDLYYTLSVKVKGIKNIQESFENLVTGETIKDYFCEACQSKNDIVKRQCLSTLPNVMIVHLQRIVFNLDIMQNEKLSSRFEFPHQLNLEPYTREGLKLREQGQFNEDDRYALNPREYYEYKLKGVVIHKGTAGYGHYYSLVNHKADKWIKFNDSIIEDFEIRRLASESFGGKESEDNSEFWTGAGIDVSSTNAYILVYERLLKKDIVLRFKEESEKQEIMAKIPLAKDIVGGLEVAIHYHDLDRYIPQDLYQEVWWDNHKFMFEKHIYCDDFFRFVKDIISNLPLPIDLVRVCSDPDVILPYYGIYNKYQDVPNQDSIFQMAYNAIYLVTEVIPFAAESGSIKEYVPIIKNLINIIPLRAFELFRELVFNKSARILSILVNATEPNVRTALTNVILHLLNVSIYIHALTLDIAMLEVLQTDDPTIRCEQQVMRFIIDLLLNLQTDVAKNPTKIQQFFEFIRDFVKSGQAQLEFANQIQLISILADFFMEKGSPLWSGALEVSPIGINFGDKKYTLSSKVSSSHFTPIFQCIAYMLVNKCNLSKNDQICLDNQYFYTRALSESIDYQSLNTIILRMSWGNEELQRKLCDVLLSCVGRTSYESVGTVLELIYPFMTQLDNFIDERIEWLLGFPQPVYQNTTDYMVTCSHCLNDQCTTFSNTFGTDAILCLLDILFQNRRRFENHSLVLMRLVLYAANNNKKVFAYLVNCPTPSYLYAKYVDWFPEFLDSYKKEVARVSQFESSILFNMSKEYDETMQQWIIFVGNYNNTINQSNALEITNTTLENTLLESVWPNYILGQAVQSDVISKTSLVEGVTLQCIETTHYLAKSLPTMNPSTNAIFPQCVLHDNVYIQGAKIDPQSNIWSLLGPKYGSTIPKPPPLPLNKKSNNDIVDGIDFGQQVKQEQQQQESNNEMSKFQIEMESIGEQTSVKPQAAVGDKMEAEPEGAVSVAIPLPAPVYELVDVPLFTSNMLRRYQVKNETAQVLYLTFQIQVDNDQFVNFKYPTKVCRVLLPKCDTHIVTISKTIHDLDWGYYGETTDIQYSSENSNTTNPPENPKNNNKTDEGVQVYPAQQEYGPQLPATDGDQISCPTCTFIQSSKNHFCELCTASFK